MPTASPAMPSLAYLEMCSNSAFQVTDKLPAHRSPINRTCRDGSLLDSLIPTYRRSRPGLSLSLVTIVRRTRLPVPRSTASHRKASRRCLARLGRSVQAWKSVLAQKSHMVIKAYYGTQLSTNCNNKQYLYLIVRGYFGLSLLALTSQ